MSTPLVIAHRGFSGKFPENTKRAFVEAIAVNGCNGFETDVHLSSDNEPVIIHDSTLDRTTDAKGPVRAMKFKDLRELDVGSWMEPQFSNERILHLDELLELSMKNDKVLNIELKNYETHYPNIEQIVIDRIRAVGAQNHVFLSSFNHISMGICKSIDAEIKTGFLYFQPLLEAEKYAAGHKMNAIHPMHQLLNFEPLLVGRAHSMGVAINTWTVNNEDDMRSCISLGVDSIITDFPDKLAEVLVHHIPNN